MYDGKIQQIGKVIEIDKQPLNLIIAKIMGSINVWPIEYIEKKDKQSIVSTPIGSFQIPYIITDWKPSGIKIPSEALTISFKEGRVDHFKDMKYNVLNGTIKSIVEKEEETFRIIIDLTDTISEYIKVDYKKELLKGELKSNQEVIIYVDPKEVVLI